MASPTQNWPTPEEAELRAILGKYYKALKEDAEEGALAARGIENRQSVNSLILKAAFRSAEHYSALRALIPDTKLPEDPNKMTLSVLLMPVEVSELAQHHDAIATVEEKQGNHHSAQKRRNRAEQLRELVPGVGQ